MEVNATAKYIRIAPRKLFRNFEIHSESWL